MNAPRVAPRADHAPASNDAAPVLNAPVEEAALPQKPYPGLRAFDASEWAIYWGRENAAKEVIKLLVKRGLVLIHGASGCGKSSLVRAGVLPSLEIDHEITRRRWQTAVMRPSEGPLKSLAGILETHLAGLAPRTVLGTASAEPDEEPITLTTWHDHVFDGRSLVAAVEAALAEAKTSLCIVVDQFEEIFRWSRDLGARKQASVFVEFLRASGAKAGRKPQRLFVILTMRSDYLGHCAQFDGFAEFLNERQYLLPKIDDFGLLCAIHEPAALFGGSVENAAAERLLPMVAKEQDGLPVLQHALMRAWEIARKRTGGEEGWRITVDDLTAVGGADALAVHAEQILQNLIDADPKAEEGATWIFRALTDLDADRRAIRRPCKLGELVEISGVGRERALDVIEAFRAEDCCFLSPYEPAKLSDDSEIDISHEALIRRWARISDHTVENGLPKGWLDREFQDGLVWRLLAVTAQAFRTDRRGILSPASAKTRGEWYETIKPRKAWIKRHAVAPDPDDPAGLEDEWDSVAALMAASERNRRIEESTVVRLRHRTLILAVAAVVAAAVAIVGIFVIKDLEQKRAVASVLQDQLTLSLCRLQEETREQRATAGGVRPPIDQAQHEAAVASCVTDMKKQYANWEPDAS